MKTADDRRRRRTREITVAIRSFVVVLVAALASNWAPARAAGNRTITLTLVRHAQSAANASGLIDTSVPGPELSPRGFCQAAVVAPQLAPNHYDGVYASNHDPHPGDGGADVAGARRTRHGAARAAGDRGRQVRGHPEADIPQTYFAAPARWIQGDRTARIPGSVDGNEFNARFTEAVQRIYDSGEQYPVAFSHSAAIMFWVLMNARNADPSLLKTKSLTNVGHVVVTGNPSDGWTMTEWDADPPPC
ncbi:histidine phosphatase family protein [Mycobacterium genavense]|uniref:histidine phosphatase family protein n=1 Tax=Mycobacterium genavense TaxID=36812 RepID=UPI001FE05810|nr:histidine phosphatase family protein [Mycobacterium genavense]